MDGLLSISEATVTLPSENLKNKVVSAELLGRGNSARAIRFQRFRARSWPPAWRLRCVRRRTCRKRSSSSNRHEVSRAGMARTRNSMIAVFSYSVSLIRLYRNFRACPYLRHPARSRSRGWALLPHGAVRFPQFVQVDVPGAFSCSWRRFRISSIFGRPVSPAVVSISSHSSALRLT